MQRNLSISTMHRYGGKLCPSNTIWTSVNDKYTDMAYYSQMSRILFNKVRYYIVFLSYRTPKAILLLIKRDWVSAICSCVSQIICMAKIPLFQIQVSGSHNTMATNPGWNWSNRRVPTQWDGANLRCKIGMAQFITLHRTYSMGKITGKYAK